MNAVLVLIRRIVVAAWRFRWAAVAAAWVVCGVGWAFVATMPNQYQASARLYVNADQVLTPLLKGIALENTLASQLSVLQRTLLSRPNLEKLVSNTNLDLKIRGPADLEAMVQSLARRITITSQARNLFTINFTDTSPKLAYDVVNAILNTFIETKTGTNRAEMQNAQVFLQQQIDDYARKLGNAERRRAAFRTKYMDLLPLSANGASRVDQARSHLVSLENNLADQVAQRDLIAKELAATSPMVVTDRQQTPTTAAGVAATIDADPRVGAAQARLDALKLQYTDQLPDVGAAKQVLAAARKIAAHDIAVRAAAIGAAEKAAAAAAAKGGTASVNTHSMPNPVFEQIKVKLVEQETKIASLQRQISQAQQDLAHLDQMARSAPGVQAQYQNLDRDYSVLMQNYKELLARRESMSIAQAASLQADRLKIQVIDPPQVPQNPVSPPRAKLLSAVLLIGLLAGGGLAVLLVQFDQSFHTIDELRDLGLPVAGGISMLNIASTRGRLTAAMAFAASVAALVAVYGGLVYRLLQHSGSV